MDSSIRVIFTMVQTEESCHFESQQIPKCFASSIQPPRARGKINLTPDEVDIFIHSPRLSFLLC